jgi:hypothetical protein
MFNIVHAMAVRSEKINGQPIDNEALAAVLSS